MLQQLGGTDASFLYLESAETPMNIGSLYLYELPADYRGDYYEDFKAHFRSRLHLFPILTRKLVQMPLDLDAPLWMKDKDVDLDYHIRRHSVPKPGRFEQLEELVGRLHSNFLDRSRPLWEIYIIEGLADGRIAEYAKFHHAGFDGAASLAFVQNLYDLSSQPRKVPPPTLNDARPDDPDPLKIMSLLYCNGVRQYLHAAQAIPDFLKAWATLTLPNPETLKYSPLELPQPAPWTRLNVSITSQRSFAARTVALSDLKYIAKANESTVNDVVLAICSGALRRYLRDRDGLPKESLRAFVPVSVREPGNSEMNNQVVGMICDLATDVAAPLKRLRAIHESARRSKQFTDTVKAALLGASLPIGAPIVMQGMMNLLGHYHWADRLRPLVNLTVSNNIGSPQPLYLASAKLVASFPMSIPTHGAALNITVQSYCDHLHIGLTACRRTVPDVCRLGDYAVAALAELKNATLRQAASKHAQVSAQSVAPARRKTRAAATRVKPVRAKQRALTPSNARISSHSQEIAS